MVGKSFRVLVNGTDRKTGLSTGLTEGKLIVRLDKHDDSLMGKIVDVTITSAADFSMQASLQPLPEGERLLAIQNSEQLRK